MRVLEDFVGGKKSLENSSLDPAVLLRRVGQSRNWHLSCNRMLLHLTATVANEASERCAARNKFGGSSRQISVRAPPRSEAEIYSDTRGSGGRIERVKREIDASSGVEMVGGGSG